MKKSIVAFGGIFVFSVVAQGRPKEILCHPAGLLSEKSKSHYFLFSDNLTNKKTCALGWMDKLKPLKWHNTSCTVDETWKQFDFIMTKKDMKLTVKVFKDLSDGEHFEGVIFGKVKDQVIEQELTCDLEESDREAYED